MIELIRTNKFYVNWWSSASMQIREIPTPKEQRQYTAATDMTYFETFLNGKGASTALTLKKKYSPFQYNQATLSKRMFKSSTKKT